MYLLPICLSSFFFFRKMKNESRCHGVTYSRDKATLQIYLSRDKITILSLSGNYSTTVKQNNLEIKKKKKRQKVDKMMVQA